MSDKKCGYCYLLEGGTHASFCHAPCRAQAAEARNLALEEVLAVVHAHMQRRNIVAAIEALKSQPAPTVGEKIDQLAKHGHEAPYLKANPPAPPAPTDVLAAADELASEAVSVCLYVEEGEALRLGLSPVPPLSAQAKHQNQLVAGVRAALSSFKKARGTE